MGHTKKGPLPVATGAGLEGNAYDEKLPVHCSPSDAYTRLIREAQSAVAAAIAAAERLGALVARAVRS